MTADQAGTQHAALDGVRDRLRSFGLELPDPPSPRGRYAPAVLDGRNLWVSGHTGRRGEVPAHSGVVGADTTLEQAQASARQSAVNVLAAALAVVDAHRLERVIFLRGYVLAAPTFGDHPEVVDAASEVLDAVLGGRGHARAALGVSSLPGRACVELEALFGVV